MLRDDIVASTKRTVAITLDTRQYGGSKEKRGRDDQDRRVKRGSRDTRRTGHRNEAKGLRDRAVENPRQDDSTEKMRFTLPPSQLLPIIQSLQRFEWPRPQRGDPEGRDKSRFCEYHKDAKHRTNDCYRLWRLLNYLVKRGHLRAYIEEVALNRPQPLPHTSSRLIKDAILAGPMPPKTQGQPCSGIFMAEVNYSFTPSSIQPIDGLITFSEYPLRQLSMPPTMTH